MTYSTINPPTYDELGVVPPAPGQDRTALWGVMLQVPGECALTFRFEGEPEHRVIEALAERVGADDRVMIMPPTRVAEGG